MTDAPASTLPERLALLDVLSVLTATAAEHLTTSVKWPGEYLEGVACRRATCDKSCSDSVYPWQIKDPREALEALTTAGVLPESWAQDERRGFFGEVLCLLCKGRKKMVRPIMPSIDEQIAEMSQFTDSLRTFPATLRTEVVDCEQCDGTGRVSGVSVCPATIPALVAWASLGREAIMRAEALARETVVRLRPWLSEEMRAVDRVVWRVGALPKSDAPAWWPRRGRHKGLVTLFANGELGADLGWLGKSLIDCDPPADIWRMGLAFDATNGDSITANAITLCVPPIGGAQ